MSSCGVQEKGERHVTKTISISISEQGHHAGFNFDNLFILDNYVRETLPGQAFERSVVNDGSIQLYAVFDGMGEGELGVEASRVAAEILDNHRQRLAEQPEIPFKDFVREYIKEANDAICERIRIHKGLRMGTTFSLLYLSNGIARTANIGNSRIFLYRGESLIQLTYDHTQAQKLVRMGIIGREEAREHPEKNVLTQYLGIFPEEMALEPSFGPTVILQKKDTFLVTSNGITDSLDEATLRERLSAPGVFSSLPQRLVQSALDSGSRDNLSLVAVRVMDTDTEQAKLVAGAMNDVTTQIPAGEIDRAAAAAIDLMDVGAAVRSVRTPAANGMAAPATPETRPSTAWRVLTPILIFLCFVLVGAGAAKIAFSWDRIVNRPTITTTTTASTGETTVKPTTLPAGTEPAATTPAPTETTPATTATTTTETTTAATTTATSEATTTAGTTATTTSSGTTATTTASSTSASTTAAATEATTSASTTSLPTAAG